MKLAMPYVTLGFVATDCFQHLVDPSHPWWPQPQADLRSNLFPTHRDTLSVLFRWTPRGNWPSLTVEEHPAWRAMYPRAADFARRVANMACLNGDPPLNMMVARLKAGGAIEEHVDMHPFFGWARRIHVPLYVPGGCVFRCGGQVVPTVRGYAFELSNRDPHSVVNASGEDRLHIVMDFAP